MRLRHTALPALVSLAVIAALASPAAAAVHGAGRDSDRDGLPDRWETLHRLNPKRAADASRDTDQDGLTNLQEYRFNGDPRSADTDDDGVDDGLEVRLRTRLNRADSDGDGVRDGDDDANRDGICDRDQRAAAGKISSFDQTTGELVLNTRSGQTRTLTITDDTQIEQREHRGWAHVPGGPLSRGPRDDHFDDPSDDPGQSDSDDSVNPSDGVSDDDWAEDDAGEMPSDSDDDSPDAAVVSPENADLLTAGAVVLAIRLDDDNTVSELRLA